MACLKALRGYRKTNIKGAEGSQIVFNVPASETNNWIRVDIPCGQCIGCRVDRARSWSLRIYHESTLHDNCCFITLTYDESNIPYDGSLNKKHFQQFMKELRRGLIGTPIKDRFNVITKIDRIRFFHCGEYGDKLDRPHYHAILFGVDFDDKKFLKKEDGYTLYTSDTLAKYWRRGFHTISEVSLSTCAYVARYVLKKVTGKKAKEYYRKVDEKSGEIFNIIPEYITMSRNPGIAKDWFDKYKKDCFPKDYLTVDGKVFKVPKYYDRMFEEMEPELMTQIKRLRRKELGWITDKEMDKISKDKCKILDSKYKLYERNFEK